MLELYLLSSYLFGDAGYYSIFFVKNLDMNELGVLG